MKIDSNFNYRKYEYLVDYKKRESIFFDCFPSVKSTILSSKEYYLWKFHSFEQYKNSYEYAVYSNENLIGYYACLAIEYKCMSKKPLLFISGDRNKCHFLFNIKSLLFLS